MPLIKLRKEIDKIDHDLVKLLKKRKKTVEKIVKVKLKHGLEIFDKSRENQIAKKLNSYVKKYDLDKKHLYNIWSELMVEAKRVQYKILKKK